MKLIIQCIGFSVVGRQRTDDDDGTDDGQTDGQRTMTATKGNDGTRRTTTTGRTTGRTDEQRTPTAGRTRRDG